MHWLSRYIADINRIKGMSGATEASYREPIQTMLQAAAREFDAAVDVLHEPGRAKKFGSPDFLVSAKGGGVVGYVECKRPGANLEALAVSEQIRKYRVMSENIMLTDSFRWLRLHNGEISDDVRLGVKHDAKARRQFTDILRVWMEGDIEKVGDPKELADVLAHRCAMLRDGLREHESDNEKLSALHGLWRMFQNLLNKELTFADFADIFAQTFVYSLLMAKTKSPTKTQLNLFSAPEHIPGNYAVIRDLAGVLQKLTHEKYADLKSIITNILTVINGMDTAALAEIMTYKNGATDEDDPYLNFYEPFLSAYDSDLRERRGVYYTPPPVVRFIVRSADELLRRDFGMRAGLAESGVTALDFAAGTGTFMLEMARIMLKGKSKARRHSLVRDNFLPHFYGFELMASPYVIAHMKLSQFLEDSGVGLEAAERVNILLTNTLDKSKQNGFSTMASLAEEAQLAQDVKASPVLVIVGNPPYSGHSQNQGKWIQCLLHGVDDGKPISGNYYKSDGEKLSAQGEKNTKWLQDDYVKFIRFAQWKMQTEERGIVAIITNHAFLDNPTFRGMRQSLTETFDALYFLDLHGNISNYETPPGGGNDENVFDISQGVAVSLLVKNRKAKQKGVFHADLWGSREAKYAACAAKKVKDIKWKKIAPVSPFYFFTPRGKSGEGKFRSFYAVDKIFGIKSVGCTTARDRFTLGFDKEEIRGRVEEFVGMSPEQAREHYNLGEDVDDWQVEWAQDDLRDSELADNNYCRFAYRPFDTRHTYYTGKSCGFHCRPRRKIMANMLRDNIGLLTSRQHGANSPLPAFVVDAVPDINCIADMSAMAYLFPLYRYQSTMGGTMKPRANITAEFRDWAKARYGEKHAPESILGCIYAILHSPDYRKRYADLLRTEFPRIPFPKENGEFKRLARIGKALIAAHLLRQNCAGRYGKLRGDGTSHEVEEVKYKDGRLSFNKDEYFAPLPPEVFNFQIGGYKPLDKFLKARQGRKLSDAEISTMEKAANAIAFTIKKTTEIGGGRS